MILIGKVYCDDLGCIQGDFWHGVGEAVNVVRNSITYEFMNLYEYNEVGNGCDSFYGRMWGKFPRILFIKYTHKGFNMTRKHGLVLQIESNKVTSNDSWYYKWLHATRPVNNPKWDIFVGIRNHLNYLINRRDGDVTVIDVRRHGFKSPLEDFI